MKDSRCKMQDARCRMQDKKFFLLYCVSLHFMLLLATCYSLLFLTGCVPKDRMYRESRIVMDTFCTITVVESSETKAKEAIDAGFARIQELEKLLNFFSFDSEISAINNSAGKSPVKVSRETLDIIKKAVEVADRTGGAFDPTIGPLMRLWGFSSQDFKAVIPNEDKVKNALNLIGYKKIKINAEASEVFLEEKGMEMDLGGIAKGYAADLAVETIKAKGIKSALVAVGGDIRGFGLKPDMKAWKVGIQNPRTEPGARGQDEKSHGDLVPLRGSGVRTKSPVGTSGGQGSGEKDDIFATFYLQDKAVSTSGDYQRFFIKDGMRYHHILDPKTGYPATGVISVSVIAPDGFMTDGLSTGVFVLGPEKGMKLLESAGLGGIIIDSNMKIFITENLKGKIDIEKSP